MRVLIIHPEARSFAGAERVLEYYLQGLVGTGHEVAVAVAADTRCAAMIPNDFEKILIPDNSEFSFMRLCQGLVTLRRHHSEGEGFSVVHGWAARDWELASAVGRLARRPALGTLHDDPRARAISRSRRLLMRGCARYGLRKVICVSRAVSAECVSANYPADKLTVIHNGLPGFGEMLEPSSHPVCRLGFLGVFSERKGVQDLFLMLDELARFNPVPWQAILAGEAQNVAGEQLLAGIREQFSMKPWWPRVEWSGWVDKPIEFLKSVDLLIVPSSQFDPFPTVLLEAGTAGTPVLAAKVGGVEEIVVPDQTGWLFEPGNWRQAAGILARVLAAPDQLRRAGRAAFRRVGREFTIGKMVDNYLRVYSTVCPNV